MQHLCEILVIFFAILQQLHHKTTTFHHKNITTMATSEENAKTLNDLYLMAVANRLCSSKKEFGELVGVSREAITSALNGNPTYTTNKMVMRVHRALEEAGMRVNIDMENSGNAAGNIQKNFDSTNEGDGVEDMRHIVDRLVDEMAKQRESYERILMAALKCGQNTPNLG